MIKAREGYVFVSGDISQAELRLAGFSANDKVILNLYNQDADIHTHTAMTVMGITKEQWDKLDPKVKKLNRFRAKAVNFGLIYGMSARKFRIYAKTDYGIDYTEREAKAIRDAFFKAYPSLLGWHDKVRKFVHTHGYVKALDGGIRHLPSIFSMDNYISSSAERQAINSPIQGIGSNIGLRAMYRIARQNNPNMHPVMFIHDDLVFEVKKGFEWEAANAIVWAVRNHDIEKLFGSKITVPVKSEPDVGENLGEMYELLDLPDDAPDWIKAIPKIDPLNPVKPSWWRDELDI